MGNCDEPKPGSEHRTHVLGLTRANHVGDDYAPKLVRHMHTPMQLYIIVCLRAIAISCLACGGDFEFFPERHQNGWLPSVEPPASSNISSDRIIFRLLSYAFTLPPQETPTGRCCVSATSLTGSVSR